MNCPLDFDILLALALGELGASEAEEVRRHTASCPRCARASGKIEMLSGALDSLPRAEPDDGVWIGVREAVEALRRKPVAHPAWMRDLFMPYTLAGAAAALVLGLVILRLTGGGTETRREPELAVEEMGGTFARRSGTPGNMGKALASYFHDARAIAAETLRCAAAGDEACWRGVKMRAEGGDMLSRGERLASPGRGGLTAGQKALVGDSARLVRALSEWPPSRLAAEGRTLAREIARADLTARLEKEGAR
ncbi:MAG: zf-HC2 domain-containing protein [Chlamydiota bacterium]